MVLAAVLGDAFLDLPQALQAFHGGQGDCAYVGSVDVTYGGTLARHLGRLGGFPPAGRDVPLRMRIRTTPNGEIWDRDFDGHVLRSMLWRDGPSTVSERLGRVEVRMRPAVRNHGLAMPVIGLRSLGISMPGAVLGPSGGHESVTDDGRIAFDVASRVTGLGLLIRYRGTLQPDKTDGD